jgi:DNA polymerase beta
MDEVETSLTHFYNIGSIQAKKLLNNLINAKLIYTSNKYSLSDLRKILKNPIIFANLAKATQIDLLFNPLRVIPRPIISLIDSELHKCFDRPSDKIKFDIAGSYIRGKSTSGDIDLVIDENTIKGAEFIKKINAYSTFIKFHEPFAQGSDKITTLIEVDLIKSGLIKTHPDFKKLFKCNSSCKVNVKIDIFLSNTDDYIFALLFATGSGLFNIRMRSLAKKKGYLLNHRGLYKKISDTVLEKIPVKSETEIFRILNMTYKVPTDRIK